jgi:hypothetical protein
MKKRSAQKRKAERKRGDGQPRANTGGLILASTVAVAVLLLRLLKPQAVITKEKEKIKEERLKHSPRTWPSMW